MNVITDFLTINKWSRPGTKRSRTTKIAWHYVGNPNTSAKANRNYFQNNGKVYASSNYIIGLQGEILYIVPEDEIAYATNSANSYSISIECCHPTDDGHFNDATYQSMVELGADLCRRYKLDPINDMIRHYDVTGKDCPRWFVSHPDAWQQFKRDVQTKMNGGSTPSPNPVPPTSTTDDPEIKRYPEDGKCTVITDTLNIRSKPNDKSEIVGKYSRGESVIYDLVVITEKYVWISWVGGSGNRRYMVVKVRSTGTRYGECGPVDAPSKPSSDDPEIKRYAENGKCTVLVDSLNIRALPNDKSEVVGKYSKGESLRYDMVVLTQKYVWISWIGSSSGKRRYMVVKVKSTGERYGRCE